MRFEDYLEYIINKFKVELSNHWTVEIVSYYSILNNLGQEINRYYNEIDYLKIANGHWNYSFCIDAIKEMFNYPCASAETAYQDIKRDLQDKYIKSTLWKTEQN